MSKRVPRAHHRRRRSSTTHVVRDIQRRARVELSTSGHQSTVRLLDRILAEPHLAQIVPRLKPEVLHRVIQHYGLEDCGQLLTLATPDQLTRLFDLDLWRPTAPGLDERFDAERFGRWLEVMVEAGVSSAATTLAAMDVNLVAAGFVQHIRVFDYAAVAPFTTLDGEEVSPDRLFKDSLRCEVGGYVVSAKRIEFWDAVTAVLIALADAHGSDFNRVMRRCCRLSHSRPEVDGLDDMLTTNEQAMFDLALDREARHDTQGYVTPAQARAFLQTSRRIDIRHETMPPRDPMTRAYFRSIDVQTPIERDNESPEMPQGDQVEPARDAPAEAVTAFVDLLHEAGVVSRPPRALLEGPQTSASRLACIRAHLQFAHQRDANVYALRNSELVYLANVILAGSTIQSRSVTVEEASNAAVAVCNLGLENWPAQWVAGEVRRDLSEPNAGVALPEDFLIHHDLVSVFQVGWTVLHEEVCMYAADRLISILASLRCADRDVQAALETLRVTLTQHWRAGSPWDDRDALDVIAILDTPSWAALLGLIDQLPTLHAAVGASLSGTTRQIDPSAFEFISANAQIHTVRDFMQWLPGRLRT